MGSTCGPCADDADCDDDTVCKGDSTCGTCTEDADCDADFCLADGTCGKCKENDLPGNGLTQGTCGADLKCQWNGACIAPDDAFGAAVVDMSCENAADTYNEYTNLDDAKAACEADAKCGKVCDKYCDGRLLTLCTRGSGET